MFFLLSNNQTLSSSRKKAAGKTAHEAARRQLEEELQRAGLLRLKDILGVGILCPLTSSRSAALFGT